MGSQALPRVRKFSVDTDPHLVWQTVQTEGAAIISRTVPLDVVSRFNGEMEAQVESWEDAEANGWRNFSPHTKFTNGLVWRSHTYRQDILNNEVIHRLCKSVFEQNGDYWMVSNVFRQTQSGHPAQPWHRDANGWPLVKFQQPEAPPLTITIIIPTTPFTEENGATRIYFGSQHWKGIDPPGGNAQYTLAEADPGDMLLMREGMVHSGGAHTKQAPDDRGMLLLSIASCQLSMFESPLGLEKALVESLTPLAQRMVGWRTAYPLNSPVGINTYRSKPIEEKLGL
ncbi:related to phytanoyl-CoA dioxygenase family protein [Ramularia collo-cygni]|uniref:Related to phytanoyl-CoA dioxygenase family protein n=1 Tax=Ramularia collo-cygni TaxID=112498 RepID=A0A2D3UW94_9PEZI|nr:related to phytanoyl-CoA dioxygenase family protein [Ramularia collo-cygni]CZT16467.1 related to phytanoyl-CoA dioxygenase family protein [Ramularia collo-cygni]